jgi:hypothetical protein
MSRAARAHALSAVDKLIVSDSLRESGKSSEKNHGMPDRILDHLVIASSRR